MTYDEALEIVYGEPYGGWKKKHQSKATDEQMAAFEGNKHLHAKHEKDLLDPPAPRPGAPPRRLNPAPPSTSDVLPPADECAPPGLRRHRRRHPGRLGRPGRHLRLDILTVSDRASNGGACRRERPGGLRSPSPAAAAENRAG